MSFKHRRWICTQHRKQRRFINLALIIQSAPTRSNTWMRKFHQETASWRLQHAYDGCFLTDSYGDRSNVTSIAIKLQKWWNFANFFLLSEMTLFMIFPIMLYDAMMKALKLMNIESFDSALVPLIIFHSQSNDDIDKMRQTFVTSNLLSSVCTHKGWPSILGISFYLSAFSEF